MAIYPRGQNVWLCLCRPGYVQCHFAVGISDDSLDEVRADCFSVGAQRHLNVFFPACYVHSLLSTIRSQGDASPRQAQELTVYKKFKKFWQPQRNHLPHFIFSLFALNSIRSRRKLDGSKKYALILALLKAASDISVLISTTENWRPNLDSELSWAGHKNMLREKETWTTADGRRTHAIFNTNVNRAYWTEASIALKGRPSIKILLTTNWIILMFPTCTEQQIPPLNWDVQLPGESVFFCCLFLLLTMGRGLHFGMKTRFPVSTFQPTNEFLQHNFPEQ